MAVGTPGKNNYSTTHRYSLRFPAASIRSQILLTALKIDVAPTPFVSPTTIGILVSRTISPTTLPLHPTWSATTLLARGYQSRSYHSSDIYAETCTKRVPAAAVPPIINCTIVKFPGDLQASSFVSALATLSSSKSLFGPVVDIT